MNSTRQAWPRTSREGQNNKRKRCRGCTLVVVRLVAWRRREKAERAIVDSRYLFSPPHRGAINQALSLLVLDDDGESCIVSVCSTSSFFPRTDYHLFSLLPHLSRDSFSPETIAKCSGAVRRKRKKETRASQEQGHIYLFFLLAKHGELHAVVGRISPEAPPTHPPTVLTGSVFPPKKKLDSQTAIIHPFPPSQILPRRKKRMFLATPPYSLRCIIGEGERKG